MSGSVFLVLWLLGWFLTSVGSLVCAAYLRRIDHEGWPFVPFLGILGGFSWFVMLPTILVWVACYKLIIWMSELDIDFKVERKK